MKEVGRIW